jgi:hypothetical protein
MYFFSEEIQARHDPRKSGNIIYIFQDRQVPVCEGEVFLWINVFEQRIIVLLIKMSNQRLFFVHCRIILLQNLFQQSAELLFFP